MSRPLQIGAGILAGILVFSFFGYLGLLRLEVLPRYAFAPGWAFVGQDGERVTSEELRGEVVVYTFTYTRNRDPRRDVHGVMRELQEALRAEDTGGVPVRLVTVSFDPARDTPEVLRRRAREVGADPSLWLFATGRPEVLRTAVGHGFGAYYEERTDGSFAFDPLFVLVDGLGIVRARHRVGLPEPEVLLREIRSVVREAQAATGSARYAYEAAHFFSCYSTV